MPRGRMKNDPEDALLRLSKLSLQRNGKYAADVLAEPYQKPPKGQISQRIPNELLFQIVDYIIPETGLCLSNEPRRYRDYLTVKALARTNSCLRSEVLKRIYKRPLHLYIASGYHCRCHEISDPKHILRKNPWQELKYLPFQHWRNMTITFAPWIEHPRCRAEVCGLISNPIPPQDKVDVEFTAAVLCVFRQSHCIGTILSDREKGSVRPVNPYGINFVYEDFWNEPLSVAIRQDEMLRPTNNIYTSAGVVEPVQEVVREPIWHLSTVVGLLIPWKWAYYRFDADFPLPQFSFPKFSLTVYDTYIWGVFHMFLDDPEVPVAIGENILIEFGQWWRTTPVRMWVNVEPYPLLYGAVNQWQQFASFLDPNLRAINFFNTRSSEWSHDYCISVRDWKDHWGTWRDEWKVLCRFERRLPQD